MILSEDLAYLLSRSRDMGSAAEPQETPKSDTDTGEYRKT